ILWERAEDVDAFDLEKAQAHLHIPFLEQLFYDIRHPHYLRELGLARHLAEGGEGEALAAVLGADPAFPASEVAARGGDRVFAAAHPHLAHYTADAFAAVLKKLVEAEKISCVLFSHSPLGWDLAPKLAASFSLPALTEVVGVDTAGSVWTRMVFNGKLQVKMKLSGAPAVVTVQKGAFPAFEEKTSGRVVPFTPAMEDVNVRQRFVEMRSAPQGKLDLPAADIIVSGGRALGGPEKFGIIRELADALGGQIGASRPVTDSGWLPHEHQIGSSGVTVKPKLYIAAGISGAIQHVVGMKQSGYIVAINRDREAPIFEVADVGVVGDLFEIVPALTRAVQEAKGKG
ncbi:MAG: electron transfer flavoprotein subunit alpha/FixB family protein, partial [Acidobacteriota bacterium]